MNTLANVLKFIELKQISVRKFEKETGLSNGTINGCIKRRVDLSVENIEKIVEKFHKEITEAGFYIIDVAAFGKEGLAIISEDQKAEIKLPYTITNDIKGNLGFIEINTASGKKLTLTLEGKSEIDLLNAFLEERDRVINTLKDEKQARIDELKQDKENLLHLLNSSLGDISKVQQAIFAMVRTLQQHEAVITSQGNKKREVEMLSVLSTLNGENLSVDARQGNGVVLHK